MSGKIPWEQRAIGRMARSIPEGSNIIVPEFSRIGRGVADVQRLMGVLHERRISLIDAKTGERFDGGRDSMLKTSFLAYFADLEREMISQRTKAGLAAAVARGKTLGRPAGERGRSKLDPYADLIRERVAQGVGGRRIAVELSGLGIIVSGSRVSAYATERGLRPSVSQYSVYLQTA